MNPEDDIYIDTKTSCSREEVVAKLIGWLQGTRRRPFTEVTKHGISADQLPNMHSFDGSSVMNLLREHRDSAQEEYFASAESGDLVETVQAKEMVVIRCDELIDKAQSYFVDIDDEIAKGDVSALRIDKIATELYEIAHYTLKSVDAWTMQTYGISIAKPPKSKPVENNVSEYPVDVRTDKKGLTQTSANSLFLTFGVLIQAFIKNNPDLSKDTSKPIVSKLAEYLSEHAIKLGTRNPIYGQSQERIMDRIEEAVGIYEKAMKLE